jgi:hypothetical protein
MSHKDNVTAHEFGENMRDHFSGLTRAQFKKNLKEAFSDDRKLGQEEESELVTFLKRTEPEAHAPSHS